MDNSKFTFIPFGGGEFQNGVIASGIPFVPSSFSGMLLLASVCLLQCITSLLNVAMHHSLLLAITRYFTGALRLVWEGGELTWRLSL